MNLDVVILHLKADLNFQKVIQTTTVAPLTPSGNIYFDLLNSIVSKQLSVKAADTIFNRFCNLFPASDPQPELLMTMAPDQLRAAGVSNQKAAYLKNVAAFVLENNLENYPWHDLSDTEIISML